MSKTELNRDIQVFPMKPMTFCWSAPDQSADRIFALATVVLVHALIFVRLTSLPLVEHAATASSESDELQAVFVDAGHLKQAQIHGETMNRPDDAPRDNAPASTSKSGTTAHEPADLQPTEANKSLDGSVRAFELLASTALTGAQKIAEPTDLLSSYRAALRVVADDNWDASDAPVGSHCVVEFTQIPGGEVVSAQFKDCPLDAHAREAVERAMHKTPMPYVGFESVFGRQQTIDFCHPSDACVASSP